MRKIMDRIKDFDEIYTKYDINNIKPLLDNCMNCNEPFCSNKIILENHFIGCPIDVDIKKIISLLKYNLFDEAYAELIKNNPFPELVCRVCEGYCEKSCINNKNNINVPIKDIVRTLADYGLDNNLVESNNITSNNKKINIIGSGIAGLSCAYHLLKNGYKVTIYEKEKEAGGTLMYGISNMRLDKSILKRRIELLKKMGAEFILDTEISRVISPMDLLNSSDALIVSSGVVKKLYSTKGMGLKNIMYATDYLKKVTKNILDTGISNILENKSVLVLGSGKTTEDVISYAIREKAKMVATIDYKNMPPLNRTNSWPLPSDALEVSEAYKEARSKMVMDPRSYNMTIREIVGTTEVESLKICQVKWIDNKPVMQDHDQIFPVDVVIISIGTMGYEEDLISYFDLDIINKLVDEKNHKNSDKVFICGDALLNNGITPLAEKDGLNCAKEVIEYLEAKY